MLRRRLLGLIALMLLPSLPVAAQQGTPVDLELVLAVDASSSVNRSEFDLQMRGLASAFRSPGVHSAIKAAGQAGIAVMLFQWADNRNQSIGVDWMVIRSAEDAELFAQAIDNTPRLVVGGGTAIGGAIDFAVARLAANGFDGHRKVIDVSGDGRANQGSDPREARDRALALGIVVNGLAILNEDPTLDLYYRNNVIGGAGAFVIPANDYNAYAEAIVEKLIREISNAPVAALPKAGAPTPGEGG